MNQPTCPFHPLILALVLIPAVACAESLFEEEAKVRISIRKDPATGRTVTEQHKVNYHPHFISWNGDMKAAVVRETVQSSQESGLEGTRSHLKVDIYLAADDEGRFPKAPTSTLEIPQAHEARYFFDHWSAWTFGCCDAESYGRLYSYGGSKPFLRFNERCWKISVPNDERKTRYVGLALRDHVPNDAAREALFSGHPDAIACLSYAAPGKLLASVYLKPRKGKNKSSLGLHTGELTLSSASSRDKLQSEGDRDGRNSIQVLEMWSLDGAEPANRQKPGVSGARITASVYLDDGTTEAVTVTVENDRLVNAEVTGKVLEAETARPPLP